MKKTSVEILKDLGQAINSIEETKLFVESQAIHIERLQVRNERQPEFYRFRIIKHVMKLICSGLDEESACQAVAMDYKGMLRAQDIAYLWKKSRRDRNALNLYARVYMAKKMRLAGFKLGEIAGSMNLSLTSIQKLLNSDAVLD